MTLFRVIIALILAFIAVHLFFTLAWIMYQAAMVLAAAFVIWLLLHIVGKIA